MAEKPVIWLGNSLNDLRAFPDEARRSAGHELHLVQLGQEPSDWKPMTTVGPGVMELRIHTKLEHRVFYVAKFSEAVYVIHAFQKTTRKTSKPDVDLAKKRFTDLTQQRSKQKEWRS